MTSQSISAASKETYSVMPYKRDKRFVCWMTKIGYHKNKAGERVRTWQYHGDNYANAQRAALELAERWEAIVRDYKNRKAHHDFIARAAIAAAESDGYYIDGHDDKIPYDSKEQIEAFHHQLEATAPELPTWPENELKHQRVPKSKTLTLDFGAPSDPTARKPRLATTTISSAKEIFNAIYEARVGLQGPRGLKQRTCFQAKKHLEIALRAVDESSPVTALDRQAIESAVNYWLSPERKIAERTAGNYLRAFRAFLRELKRMNVGYTLPDVDDLFHFRNVKGTIAKYDKKQVRALLNAVDERCKLFQLLALNCGFYQGDICILRAEEIVKIKGETYIARRREKSSHQNDFKSCWWLFPETAVLLAKFSQKKGYALYALLKPDGEAMVATSNDYVTGYNHYFLGSIIISSKNGQDYTSRGTN